MAQLETYSAYIDEGLIRIGTSTALEWWTNTAQWTRFPTLSRMAIAILSLPAMSAEVELLFSAAKNTVGDERSSLNPSTLEALECLKSCFRLDKRSFVLSWKQPMPWNLMNETK